MNLNEHPIKYMYYFVFLTNFFLELNCKKKFNFKMVLANSVCSAQLKAESSSWL